MQSRHNSGGEHLEELRALRARIGELEALQERYRQDLERLSESERRYRHLVEHSLGLICIHGLDGELLWVNPAASRALGFEPGEDVGKSVGDFLAPDVRPLLPDYLKRISREPTDTGIMRVVTKSGEERLWYYRNLRYEEAGRPPYVLGHAVDITELKRAEARLRDSEERWRLLFEFAPDAYYLSDTAGVLIDGNRAAEQMVGYERRELIGKSFLEVNVLSADQVPRAAALLADSLKGKPTGPDEFNLTRKDGREVTVEIRTFPLNMDGRPLVLGIARDITGRKRAEEALLRARDELEVRVFSFRPRGQPYL